MDKRKEFKKGLAALGTTAVIALGGFGINAAIDSQDLSKYAVDDDKYVDYIKGSENEKLEKLEKLDEDIKRYEELSSRMMLSKEEKDELKEIIGSLKNEMREGNLEKFYLHDLLKEKIKATYGVNRVETKWDMEFINIKLYDKYDRYEMMDDKDLVPPIRVAMDDIATLQGYQGYKDFSRAQVENFIRIQKNMKGFSNIDFVKVDGKPLVYTEPQKDEDLEK